VGCQTNCEDRAKEVEQNAEEKAAMAAFLKQERDIGVSKQAFRRRARHG